MGASVLRMWACVMRFPFSAISSNGAVKLVGAVCLASLAAGCSSGVTRFDHGVTVNDIPQSASTSSHQASSLAPQRVGTVSSGPALAQPYPGDMSAQSAPQPLNTNYSSGNTAYQQPVSVASSSIERQPLRPAPVYEQPANNIALSPVPSTDQASPRMASYGSSDPVVTGAIPTPAPRRRSVSGAAGWTTEGGTRVTVGEGETLYNLSRRYGVPAKEIMKVNNISDPNRVVAGQVVIIPAYGFAHNVPVSAPDNDPNTRSASAGTGYQGPSKLPVPEPSPIRQAGVLPNGKSFTIQNQSGTTKTAPAPAPQTGNAVYTVQSGDSLSRIASRAGVSVTSLKEANGLTNSNIRVGQKLRLPSGGNTQTVQTVNAAPVKRVTTKPTTTQELVFADEGETPKTTGIGKLRWPARGQIMNDFGSTDNGTRNDGIDISMPKGTPVKAAENGVVIYAGSGLKEYGNTVLVRHDDGLVTVYGHASELIVKRGDNVSRGQVVAMSGMSGQANRPKLHFEIRKDAKPVDPLSYLE